MPLCILRKSQRCPVCKHITVPILTDGAQTNHFITVCFLIWTHSGLQSRCQERNYFPLICCTICFDNHQWCYIFMLMFLTVGYLFSFYYIWELYRERVWSIKNIQQIGFSWCFSPSLSLLIALIAGFPALGILEDSYYSISEDSHDVLECLLPPCCASLKVREMLQLSVIF